MVRDTLDPEQLLADLADHRRRLAAAIRERDDLASQLRIAREGLEAEQGAKYGAYRQLVELERVRAFDDIARGIEHDLFNALTPVEGYTELLLMDPKRLADPAQATAYLNAIMAAAQDAKAIIQRMREFYYGYSSETLDIGAHGSISQVLAQALASGEIGEGPAQAGEMDLDDTGTESLSPREWDVLRLLSAGMKNREIAETLSVSENTVKTHIKAILSKLSLKNRTQAAAYALLDQQAFEPTAGAG